MWNENTTMQNEGGYMDSSMNNTIMSVAGGSNLMRGQNCVPLMIAHINRTKDDLTVWGMTARIVTIVAIVHKIDSTSTKVYFEFQDETGSIRGIKWLSGDMISYESPVEINNYARVYGVVRSQNKENYILINNIQPLEHLNELLSHLMEVTLMCLEGEKMMNKVVESDQSCMENTTSSSGYNNSTMDNSISGLNGEQRIVFNTIKDFSMDDGIERNVIKSRVPSSLAARVDEILEFLSSEGHIYTTKTDDFFKII